MKKLLLLGGSAQQVIAIETAKQMGYATVLCDYLPDNPGQYAADTFYLVSTTDREAILAVARAERVDGVLAYASDPAAPTAAYVAEQLGLPGNPYASVETLCKKDRFRAFLAQNGFCTPKAEGYADVAAAARALREGTFSFPVIVKPVDSSGSKGVAQIRCADGCETMLSAAMDHSRCGRILIEEFVEKQGYQVAGDGLSIDGQLVFTCFGNDHFDPACVNPFVPVAASFPLDMPATVQAQIRSEIQRLLTLLNMRTCTYNFDIRVGRDGRIYLMEIAPRDGGNYIPQIIRYATGVDLVACSVQAAMGEPIRLPEMRELAGFWSYYAVHSRKDGVLRRVTLSEAGRQHIVENHLLRKPGDAVQAFTGANTTLGCLLLRFDDMAQMLDWMECAETWLRVELEGDA